MRETEESETPTQGTQDGEPMSVDPGYLPPWEIADLPRPLPFSAANAVRTVGPGAILLAGSIGGGEWIIGPMVTVQYGSSILWIATVGIVLQMMFNLEAIRYTLYTGEPILTGIMRLAPGPTAWAVFYLGVGVFQLGVPALALGCANVIFSAAANRVPDDAGADASGLLWIAYGVIAGTVVLLLSGKSIERVLERISWFMILLIFAFLIVANLVFVPMSQWQRTLIGFFSFGALPAGDIDVLLLATLAATAGSGGLGNLAVANWVRDKGFAMGALTGGIGGALASDRQQLQPTGVRFRINQENLSRWRDWWRYAVVDQTGLWATGCAVGMFLNVNLAMHMIPPGETFSDFGAGVYQAEFMARTMWSGFWFLCLLNGFWVLLSTHIGNTDILVRTATDISWAAWPRVRAGGVSRLYAAILLAVTTWGAVALLVGESVISLFKILGAMASPIMAIAAVQIWRVNSRFLPRELQPPLWRRLGLLLCGLFYGLVAILLGHNTVMSILSQSHSL